MTEQRRTSRGMRFTERVLLPFFGPADVRDPRSGPPADGDVGSPDRQDRVPPGTTRVVGSDGRVYLRQEPDGTP